MLLFVCYWRMNQGAFAHPAMVTEEMFQSVKSTLSVYIELGNVSRRSLRHTNGSSSEPLLLCCAGTSALHKLSLT